MVKRFRGLLAISFVIANMVACAKPAPAEIVTGDAHGVVLPVSVAPGVLNQCSRSTPGAPDGYWEPTEHDVQSLERQLPSYLKARAERSATRVLKQLPRYKRQYAGFLRGGRKTIYVNFFIAESAEPWRTKVVLVCDGGTGFWGVEFDLGSQTFSHIAYNGVA